MKKKIAIVTGADKKYFPYLKNLVHSLQKSKTLEKQKLPLGEKSRP